MKPVEVRHANGEYEIRFGSLVTDLPEWLAGLGHGRRLVVTDRNVAVHLEESLQKAIGKDVPMLVLEPGDERKDLRQLEKIWDALAEHGIRRDGLLIAVGGGVVGDMTGFAAATWMRGIDFFQVPTTLLAQVDASVGGKTAINHAAGKNLVGAFHQPRGVLLDTALLDTLPVREYRAGIAEIIKAALIGGERELTFLESDMAALVQRDADAVHRQARAAILLKKKLVEADERESGNRSWLNLGHTFAHAIEQGLGYGKWLHGEAVAAGLVAACRTSEHLTGLDPAVTDRVMAMLNQAGLPQQLPEEIPLRDLLQLMNLDKKATAENVRLVLLQAPGTPLVHPLNPATNLEKILAASVTR